MKQSLRLFCLLSMLLLITACTKEPSPTPTAPPHPTATATPTVEAAKPTATPTATATPSGVDLPLPLYLLSDGAIWLLSPGDDAPQQLAIEGEASSMDVWSEDNRIAYGTTNGKLYTLMAGQKPVLLHNVQEETESPVRIGHVAWSSDGTQLAYTVAYTSEQMIYQAGYPSYPSGLWVLDLQTQSSKWLLSNHYLRGGEKNFGQLRIFSIPRWSPDSTALLLLCSYWEWPDYSILESMSKQLDETSLYDLDSNGWGDGFWTRDGESVLLSGQSYAGACDLLQVDRVTKETRKLIDGEADNLYVSDAQELPDGIVLLGERRIEQPEKAQLYLGKLTEQGFEYAPTGPVSLCNTRETSHIEWDPSGHWGVFVCQYGRIEALPEEIHVISLDGKNLEITPYLTSLPDVPSSILWGSR
jgi:hypothetical protein